MRFHLPAILLSGVALALGVAACGGDDDAATSPPKPVAQVDQLSGRSTAVMLDGGFVKALQTLELTPARSATRRSARPASRRSRSPAAA
jgi:hypothetical protein